MRRRRLTLSGQRLLVASLGLALLGTQFGRPGLVLLGVLAFAVVVMALLWCPAPPEPREDGLPDEIVAAVHENVSIDAPFLDGSGLADRYVQWRGTEGLTPEEGRAPLDTDDRLLRVVAGARGIGQLTISGGASDPWGLVARRSQREVDVRVVMHPARVAADTSAVHRLQAARDHGDDLDGTRPWRAGDRSAAVDWRGFARGDGLRVRQRTETVERVVVHLVGAEPLTDAAIGLALDAALRLAATGVAVELPLRALAPGQWVAPQWWAAIVSEVDVVRPDELPGVVAHQQHIVVAVPTGPSGVDATSSGSVAAVRPLSSSVVSA